MRRRIAKHWKWLVAGVAVLAALAIGGPFVYINFIEGPPPAPLSLPVADPTAGPSSSAPAPTGPPVAVDGTWTVSTGSQAGYRAREVLFGQSTEAVGRTDRVSGTMVIAGKTVRNGEFTVDLTSVASDQSQRDNQFRGRIMDVAQWPDAKFTLASPINLGTVPAVGAEIAAKATGHLAMHGTTKQVTIDLKAVRAANTITVNGSIPVLFADYGIANPSFGPAQTEDNGQIEFLLTFTKS